MILSKRKWIVYKLTECGKIKFFLNEMEKERKKMEKERQKNGKRTNKYDEKNGEEKQ